MATRTWSSASSTDMNLATNYSGSGALLTSDDLVYNGTSVVNATASANLNVNSVTVTLAYTGNWSNSGRIIDVNTTCTIDGTGGTVNLGTAIKMSYSTATFFIGSGVGTVTSTNCEIQFQSACTTSATFTDNKGITIRSFTLNIGSSCTLTLTGSATTIVSSATSISPWNTNTAGTIVIDKNITVRANDATNTAFMVNNNASVTYTLNSGKTWRFDFASGRSWTLPALTIGGSGGIVQFTDNAIAATTTTLAGALNIGSHALTINESATSGSSTWTTSASNYAVTCGALDVGFSQVSGTPTHSILFNASTVTIASFTSATNNVAGTINLGTGAWGVTGNWTCGSGSTLTASTSAITFTGTGSSAVTFAGKTLYDITFNNASKAASFIDGSAFHNLTTTAMASFTTNGYGSASSGNLTFNGSGTLDLGGYQTMSAASANITFGSTLGTVTASTAWIIFQGTTATTFTDNKGVSLKVIQLGGSAVCTSNGLATTTLNADTEVIQFGNNSTFTINSAFTVSFTTSRTAFSFGTSTTFNGTGAITIDGATASVTTTVPATTYTGSGAWTFAPAATSTVTLSGAFNIGANDLTISAGIFTQNSQVITCRTVSFTTSAASTCNAGWTISGDWTWGASSSVTVTSMTITSSKNGAVFTSNGKPFGQITINDSATFTGGCTISRFIFGVDGKVATFQSGQTFVFTNVTASNWNGSAGSLNTITASTTSQANFTVPAGLVLQYMNVSYNNASQIIDVSDGTSTNGGNTTNWSFAPTGGNWFLLAMKNEMAYSS